MSHYLPVEEITQELQKAVEEFLRASAELKKEQEQLEKDMAVALEEQKMDAIKKKLSV